MYNDDENEKETCYFKETKHLNAIQKTTTMTQKQTLLMALKKWKAKTQISNRIKGYVSDPCFREYLINI